MAGSDDVRCRLWVTLAILTMLVVPTKAYITGLYCGLENCYEILGVTRDAAKNDISKAYRKLARQWHPDMHKGEEDKELAVEMFQKIANAYEIVKDDEQRKDYDYMLDNPDEYYRHYYYYYRRQAPKVDVRIVIVGTITVISVIQYLSAWNNYRMTMAALVTVPRFRLRAQDAARELGLLGEKRKKDRTKTKEELREEEENILKKVIEDKMNDSGQHRRPSVLDTLWLLLLLSPYYLASYLYWYGRWTWQFTLCRHPYGDEEKHYLIRRRLGVSQRQYDAKEDHVRGEFLQKELWISDKFKAWKAEQDEALKVALAENSRYKAYRRYMKKGGPGQMVMGPD